MYDILAKQAQAQAQAGKPSVWRPIFKFNLGGTKASSIPLRSPLFLVHPNETIPPMAMLSLPACLPACFAIYSYLLFYTSEQNILLAKFPWLYKILLVLPGWGNSTFMKAINEKNEFYIAFNKIAATLLGYLLMDESVDGWMDVDPIVESF